MEIKTVGVVGAGTMGNGIAHVFASHGYQVVLCDVEQRLLERALGTISKNLEREVAKNKITAEDRSAALALLLGAISGFFEVAASTTKSQLPSRCRSVTG